ncbi:MAG: F0F1 ATP synthase subunit epsilon [Novosphingobium sp.]|nr:F0F1 ATP synthase subunit epsilon [Novosphingobium sp.]
MSASLRLTIATPARLVIDEETVRSFRAADASGSFGIEPGHADFLTVLPASVVDWRSEDGVWHHCAVRAGVLTVSRGCNLAIAAREAVLADDLKSLEAAVHAARVEEAETNRRARAEQMRFHTYALRQILQHLMPGRHPEGFPGGPDG